MEATTVTCPTFSLDQVALVVQDHWNIKGSFKALDSYLDQNFLVKTKEGKKYVVKIANIETPESGLDLQNKVLLHLQANQIPKTVLSITGGEMVFHHNHWWRVLEFLEGTMLSNVPFHSEKLLVNVGEFAGNLTKRLSSFSHDASNRIIQWDLQQASKLINDWLEFVEDLETKKAIVAIVAIIENKSAELERLPKSCIHADLTRYNLLLDETGDQVQGLIDFGDVCLSWTIGELAVLLLETVMTDTDTPFHDAYVVVQNYHKIAPITEEEIQLLYSLIRLRSALIVCASARQLHLEPNNVYIQKQAVVDLNTFKVLLAEKNEFACHLFLEACGFYKPKSIRKAKVVSMVGNDIYLPLIDISPLSDVYDHGACVDKELFAANVEKQLKNGFGYTQYGTPTLKSIGENKIDSNTILLGVCVFSPDKTTVFAPFDLVFDQQIAGKSIFKYGEFELNVHGISHSFQENDFVKSGSILGFVTSEKSLDHFPNHFFLQLISSGSAPLYCHPSETEGWKLICQDPSFLLGIEADNKTDDDFDLATRREMVIQQAQEYYYQKPMNLVRGWKQYLFDDQGQMYLDAINNVAHIGHSRTEISSAATNQLKKLNTNARFLYKNNIEYAERLLQYFPKSLEVVFFACTGSEANDLALRLARCYTGQQDVIVIDGEYHGNTTAVDEISSCLMDNPTASKSVRSYTHPLIQPNTFRGKYREDVQNVADLYAQDVCVKIETIESQGRGVAAFISESLLGSGGGVEMPKTYLQKVYQTIRNAGGVCIADEVQIGFGRMGSHFWGFEKENVIPDIVTLGKPMGNGYPISAVVTTREIADAYKKKYTYFNTYAGNAVACQIATTVLEVIENENLQKQALEVGKFLKSELERLITVFDCVGAVYGHAMYLGVDIVTDKKSRNPDSHKALLICEALKKKGIIVYPTGDFYNILKIKPPLCFTKENAEFLTATLKEILWVVEG